MAIIEVFFLRVQFLSSQDDPRVVLRAYVASVYTSIKGSSSSSASSSSSSGGTTIIPRSGKPCPPGMEEVPALYISRIDFAVSKDKLHLIMRFQTFGFNINLIFHREAKAKKKGILSSLRRLLS